MEEGGEEGGLVARDGVGGGSTTEMYEYKKGQSKSYGKIKRPRLSWGIIV